MTIILGVIISVITCYILSRNDDDCICRCFSHCFLKIGLHFALPWILSHLGLDTFIIPAKTESCNNYFSLLMLSVQFIAAASNIKYFYTPKKRFKKS